MADHGVSGTAFGEDEMLTASQINKTRKAGLFDRMNWVGPEQSGPTQFS